MLKHVCEIPISGIRYPKIFKFNGKQWLVGSICTQRKNSICQYLSHIWEIDKDFNPLGDKRLITIPEIENELSDIYNSTWVRSIDVGQDNILSMILELKKNNNNNNFSHQNYKIITHDLFNFSFHHLSKRKTFLFKTLETENGSVSIESTIEGDPNSPSYFWGKYLFRTYIDENEHIPHFDSVVNYNSDKGHLFHDTLKREPGSWEVLFSIRKVINERMEYRIYTANTIDFVNFTLVKEVQHPDVFNWLSYPSWFELNKKRYLVTNTDDFGKTSKPQIFLHPTTEYY